MARDHRPATPDAEIPALLLLSVRQARARKAYTTALRRLTVAMRRRELVRHAASPRALLQRHDGLMLQAVRLLEEAVEGMRACGLAHELPEEPS